MDDLASDEQQLNRVKHYYHQQLQRKEEMILRLISRQKIILTDLRQQIEAVPTIVQTALYEELSAKLEYLEKEHEALTQKYIRNHTFVTSIMTRVPDPCTPQSSFSTAPTSPLSPTSSSALRARIPSIVNRDSTSNTIATAPALTNALLSCSPSFDAHNDDSGDARCPLSKFPRSLSHSHAYNNNKHNVRSPSHGPSSDPAGPSSGRGRQTAGCKLIKTLPSNCAMKRSYSCSSDSAWESVLKAPTTSTTTATTMVNDCSPQYAWSAGQAVETAGGRSAEEQLLPQEVAGADVLQNFHYSVVNQQARRTLPPTPVWLTGSSPATSDEVYTPAFEWNSERLPDFSVLS